METSTYETQRMSYTPSSDDDGGMHYFILIRPKL